MFNFKTQLIMVKDSDLNNLWKREIDLVQEMEKTLISFVKENGGEVISMTRFAVGEGIEKKQENFADEVMSQINAA